MKNHLAVLALLACAALPAALLLGGRGAAQDSAGPALVAVPAPAPISSALLSGRFSATESRGRVSADELRALHRAGPGEIHELLDLLWSHDFAPFTVDVRIPTTFAPPAGPPFEAGGPSSLANIGWQSVAPHPVPATLSGRRVVFNNRPEAWGDRGPLWGIRAYNVVGALENLELWRVGDWSTGREGHAVYLNVMGDLEVRNLRGVQCGGQLLQIVWRAGETRAPREAWPDAENLISLDGCAAVDCGAINAGMAVRASWPVSIFSTGARVAIRDLVVTTNLPTFDGGTAGPSNAHGAVLVTWGEEGRRTPVLTIDGLAGNVVKSDRSEVRLVGVGAATLRRVSLTETGGDGVCTVALVEDCDSLVIEDSTVPVRVDFARPAEPWKTVRTVMVAPGERFEWTRVP